MPTQRFSITNTDAAGIPLQKAKCIFPNAARKGWKVPRSALLPAHDVCGHTVYSCDNHGGDRRLDTAGFDAKVWLKATSRPVPRSETL